MAGLFGLWSLNRNVYWAAVMALVAVCAASPHHLVSCPVWVASQSRAVLFHVALLIGFFSVNKQTKKFTAVARFSSHTCCVHYKRIWKVLPEQHKLSGSCLLAV